MKKVVLSMLLLCAGGLAAFSQGNVLLIPREGLHSDLDLMITKEVGVAVALLQAAGYRVTVASLSGQPFVGKVTRLETDLRLADVEIGAYDGLFMACMAVGTPGPIPAEAVSLVRQAAALGIPIAAQYGSVFILSAAGILKNRKYALDSHRIAEGIYSGTGVVQDGNILTSGTCPYKGWESGRADGTAELTERFMKAIAERLAQATTR